jgi:peptidoglycan/xylan/chitin deacetylase (PgdA/CDA1 family)
MFEPFVTTYAEIRPRRPRDVARHIAVSTLSRLSNTIDGIRQRPVTHGVQFVYLHHVFDDELVGFRQLVEALGKDYRFIGYSDAVRRIATGDLDASYLCFSFDDGLACTIAAADALADAGISACFFLATGIVGVQSEDKVGRFCRDRLRFHPARIMDWKDVDRLLAAGHEIGGHTRTHADLAQLSRDAVTAEVEGCFEDLKKRVGPSLHFAWPFGRFSHFSSHARAAVFRAGFQSCASAERGFHSHGHSSGLEDLCIRRDLIIAGWPLDHVEYLLARSRRRSSLFNNLWPADIADGS